MVWGRGVRQGADPNVRFLIFIRKLGYGSENEHGLGDSACKFNIQNDMYYTC